MNYKSKVKRKCTKHNVNSPLSSHNTHKHIRVKTRTSCEVQVSKDRGQQGNIFSFYFFGDVNVLFSALCSSTSENAISKNEWWIDNGRFGSHY